MPLSPAQVRRTSGATGRRTACQAAAAPDENVVCLVAVSLAPSGTWALKKIAAPVMPAPARVASTRTWGLVMWPGSQLRSVKHHGTAISSPGLGALLPGNPSAQSQGHSFVVPRCGSLESDTLVSSLEPSLHDLHSYSGQAGAGHAENFRCASRNIDDAASCKGPAVIDPNDHVLACLEHRHAHSGPEGYSPMGAGKPVFVKRLTRRSFPTPEIIGRQADFLALAGRCRVRDEASQEQGQGRERQPSPPSHLCYAVHAERAGWWRATQDTWLGPLKRRRGHLDHVPRRLFKCWLI